MRRKFDQIANAILADLEGGKYGARLPGVRLLADTYDTNFKTAARAVSLLQDWGAVRTERGRGARVLHGRQREQPPPAPAVALLMRTTGHHHGRLSRLLGQALRSLGFFPMFSELYADYPNDRDVDAWLADCATLRPRAMIIDGRQRFPYQALFARQDELPHLLFLSSTAGIEFNADYVLSDSWLGSYLATRHLLELGHRRIMLILPRWRLPPEIFRFSSYHEVLVAYRAALEEFGADECIIYEDLRDNQTCEAAVRVALAGPDRPTAIFADGDFRCVRVYRAARELGLEIPRDLSVVGYLDTPWARQLDPQLTSVSVNPEKIAAAVAARLTYNGPRRERLRLAPTLIPRASCAPPASSPTLAP